MASLPSARTYVLQSVQLNSVSREADQQARRVLEVRGGWPHAQRRLHSSSPSPCHVCQLEGVIKDWEERRRLWDEDRRRLEQSGAKWEEEKRAWEERRAEWDEERKRWHTERGTLEGESSVLQEEIQQLRAASELWAAERTAWSQERARWSQERARRDADETSWKQERAALQSTIGEVQLQTRRAMEDLDKAERREADTKGEGVVHPRPAVAFDRIPPSLVPFHSHRCCSARAMRGV